jgi:hypothetical protein
MKRILILIGVCILLFIMPTTLAISVPTTKLAQHNINIFTKEKSVIENNISPIDDPPGWANGNFSGVWGFSIWGEWEIPIGWTFGYYRRSPTLGYFYAKFAYFEEGNTSWFIQGYFIGPFMFGSIGHNESANETLFVGIGRINETDYHWRMMGEVGPTFFVEGTYTKFD